MARLVRDDWFVNGSFCFRSCLLDRLKVSREDEGTSSAACEVEGVAGGYVVNRVPTDDLVLEHLAVGLRVTLRSYERFVLVTVRFSCCN